ncbi:MAG: DUF4184 family protein [Actinomycetota bacterium]
MPFTPSHIAAILPLARTPLPAAGLVIGSMVPDLPYFVPIGIPREYTHSLIGGLTADLPMGLIAFGVWVFVLRSPLVDFAPRWVHDRFRIAPRRRLWWAFVVLLIAALLIGIATHLLWDSFTHPDGFVVLRVAALRAQLGPFAVSRWLQYLSSVFGLVVVAIWAVRWVRRTTPAEAPYQRTGGVLRIIAWAAALGVLAVAGGAIWLRGIIAGTMAFDRVLVYDTAVYSIALVGVVALLFCLMWYLLPRRDQTERKTATTLPRSSA